MAQMSFNAAEVEPQSTFDALPAGWYVAQVIESDMKDTKAGTGQYLQLTWEILDGACAGRRVWDRLNISNPNAEAERIGRQQLSQLCHSVGVLQLQDSQQLHGKPARIKLAIRKDPAYGDSNDVKGYEPAGPGIAAAAPSIPAVATAKKPWEKG